MKKFLTALAMRNRAEDEKSFEKAYNALVEGKIRKKYSQGEENAILRKKLAGLPSGEAEFAEYNWYVELCKNEAKVELGKL